MQWYQSMHCNRAHVLVHRWNPSEHTMKIFQDTFLGQYTKKIAVPFPCARFNSQLVKSNTGVLNVLGLYLALIHAMKYMWVVGSWKTIKILFWMFRNSTLGCTRNKVFPSYSSPGAKCHMWHFHPPPPECNVSPSLVHHQDERHTTKVICGISSMYRSPLSPMRRRRCSSCC